jgi:hypothetical protein
VSQGWKPSASGAPTKAALKAAIGSDNFYALIARADPENAAKWKQMVKVQRRFKDAEPSYASDASRTYSQSNRETLHRVTLALLERQGPGEDLYRSFISVHPALFKENGAYRLPPLEQATILWHTDPGMLLSNGNPLLLARGMADEGKWKALVQQAADETRAGRREAGLPVTTSGF